MASVTEAPKVVGGARPDWARKYPPLLAIAIAMVMVLAVLPSALNLPQSNPTQTLEYAPVPDEGDDSPPQGNLSALGLGSSSGLKGGGASGGEGAGGLLDPPGDEKPVKKPVREGIRCNGTNPPRQTEDPLAPPCVPFFEGDNYGATYQGVTREEVRLLVYLDGGINYTGGSDPSNRVLEANKYYDLGEEPEEDAGEHLMIKGLRSWQEYFNLRFQTYNRTVRFFVYTSSGPGSTSETRRAEAAENFSRIQPFAVVSFATEGAEDDYLKAMARKGVLNFGSFGLRPSAFFNEFPKMIWSYLPSIEQQSDSYVSYVCKKVVRRNSELAGGDLNNRPRRIGILHTTDDKHPGLKLMAALVKQKLRTECGEDIAAEETATYPECCLAQDARDVPEYATRDMSRFKELGITTVLWTGGINGQYGKAAVGRDYYPEWIVLGDGTLDGYGPIILSSNSVAFDRRAITISPQTLHPGLEQQRCYQAYREVDPDTPNSDLAYTCDMYPNLFQFFVGVQVAGPRLGPTSIDKGFHAIPQRQTGDPQVPACFYLPGDYTCVKDAEAMLWNAAEQPPRSSQRGCWQAIEGGKRYLPGKWPDGNITAQFSTPMPCNGYSTSVRYSLG